MFLHANCASAIGTCTSEHMFVFLCFCYPWWIYHNGG